MYYFTAGTICPKELSEFFRDVFEVYEIRARVGEENSVVFKIKSNEQNHALPHVHAEYAEYSISIEIETGKVLAGTLPKSKQKDAISWVLKYKEKVLNDWKNIALSSTANMTKSKLSLYK